MRQQLAGLGWRAVLTVALKHVPQVDVRIVPVIRAEWIRDMTAAARLPARKLPANSQFERPMAIGRIWFCCRRASRRHRCSASALAIAPVCSRSPLPWRSRAAPSAVAP